jgi:very-short-patch-repair endonuclease
MEKSDQVVRAKELRIRETEAEKILWSKLRNKRFLGIKFRRQQPLGKFIVDFVSLENKLVIEIDGGQHNQEEQLENDMKRRNWLEKDGFRVIRFWNNEVLLNIDGVLEKIMETINGQSF